jgi:hypothetical protein
MNMATGTHDTEPEKPHVPTDPGLGVTVKTQTDPGVAPPLRTLEVVASATPAPVGIDRDAETPVPAISAGSPARQVPRAAALGGDMTPVPPETDGLLNGLIASENEASSRKAKASSQSSGEAAAAFHGAPHAVAPGNPTPTPEPPVLLRRSVEMELADVGALAKSDDPLGGRVERDTDPPSPVKRNPDLPDPTIPLPAPRAVWTDKAVAFGLAALAVGALGVILVKWTGASTSEAPPVEVTHVAPTSSTTAPPVAAGSWTAAIPAPPVQTAEPPAPAVDTATVAEPVSPEPAVARPGKGPRVRRAPGAAPAASSGPVEVTPPPKDDVKRSM